MEQRRFRILWLNAVPSHAQATFDLFPEGRFEVTYVRTTQDCIERLRSEDFDLVISEFEFMPTTYSKEETHSGLTTGMPLYGDIRRLHPLIPVFFFTVARETEWLRRYDDPDEHVWVFSAVKTHAKEFGEEVLSRLAG